MPSRTHDVAHIIWALLPDGFGFSISSLNRRTLPLYCTAAVITANILSTTSTLHFAADEDCYITSSHITHYSLLLRNFTQHHLIQHHSMISGIAPPRARRLNIERTILPPKNCLFISSLTATTSSISKFQALASRYSQDKHTDKISLGLPLYTGLMRKYLISTDS
jgi:hypothetical protein